MLLCLRKTKYTIFEKLKMCIFIEDFDGFRGYAMFFEVLRRYFVYIFFLSVCGIVGILVLVFPIVLSSALKSGKLDLFLL